MFDLVISDPPYGNVVNTKWDRQNDVITKELVCEIKRVCKSSASVYTWCGIGEKSNSLLTWLPLFNEQFIFKDLVTWKKQRGIGGRKGWLYTREEIMWHVLSKDFVWNIDAQYSDELRDSPYGFNGKLTKSQYKRLTNVWTDIKEESFSRTQKEKEDKFHLTPKPKKAIERIVLSHTSKGMNVLDLFSGTGTTAIVCKSLQRNCVSVEINHEYYEKIRRLL